MSAREATKLGRTMTEGGSVVSPRGTVTDAEGNIVMDSDGNVEMENVDPAFAEVSGMDTAAPVPAPPAPVQTFDFFGREPAPAPDSSQKKTRFAPRPRVTDTSPAYNPVAPDVPSPPALDLNQADEVPTPPTTRAPAPAPAPTLGQLADDVGITGGDAMARKQKRNEKRQALGRVDEEQRRAQQREATRSTDTTASEMTARRPPPLDIQSAQQQPDIEVAYGTPYDRLDASVKDSLIAYGNEPSTIPPVQRHSQMTQIPGMRQSTSAIQGHGVDEPEALREALRRSRMSSRVAQAVQDIEGTPAVAGRRVPVLVDPADQEEEKEETDVQETKTPDDDDLETYEKMREGFERSDMGDEDVRLPMPAVRQEYGQRASLRIAGARGTFNRNFSSYDRVPMESRYPGLAPSQELRRDTPYGGFQPMQPARASILTPPERRTDIDFSKYRLEKRARATIALLEDTQPRQRARNINTRITPQQVSSVQNDMGRYRRAERMTREQEVAGTRRVERYNTQPAITVSAEPVAPDVPDVPPSPELPGVGGDDL